MYSRKILLPLILSLVLVFAFSAGVLAKDGKGDDASETSSGSGKGIFRLFGLGDRSGTPKPLRLREASESSEKSESPEPSETPRVHGKDKLESHRLEFCENHHDEIEGRFSHLGDLVSGMLGKFDAIAVRVEEYYTTKVLPSGKSVSNYDALVADIAAKKAAVEAALTNAQADISGFTCTGDNPKGQLTQYRLDMQAVKKALHDYRTSIKNLIVAIRGVIGTESPEPTATPLPTATP